jgi:50S ribosomal subunit-associated GTPase HflX
MNWTRGVAGNKKINAHFRPPLPVARSEWVRMNGLTDRDRCIRTDMEIEGAADTAGIEVLPEHTQHREAMTIGEGRLLRLQAVDSLHTAIAVLHL